MTRHPFMVLLTLLATTAISCTSEVESPGPDTDTGDDAGTDVDVPDSGNTGLDAGDAGDADALDPDTGGDVDPPPEQTPYGGEPHPIPGIIQAEHFDEGGQGVAYYDTTEQNFGGAYRPDEWVDIEESTDHGGDYNVGWIAEGEWLEYTVYVDETDLYDIHLRVSTLHDGRHFHIRFDGDDVTGSIDVPNTGGWQHWTTVTVTDVELEAGERIMRLAMDSDEFNLNYVDVVPSDEVPSGDFYVSPFGDDDAAGTRDEPFRSIERARDAVRDQNDDMDGDIVVYLRDGRFEQSDTLVFEEEDSGSDGYRVIYRAYPGEYPSISGGRRIQGWSYAGDGVYRASAQGLRFRQLYVDDRPTTRARTPNAGAFHRIDTWDDAGDISVRLDASLIDDWSQMSRVEMVINKHWNQSRLRIDSYSVDDGVATVIPKEPERSVEALVEWPARRDEQAFFFENSLDFLDEPGEWYLDVENDDLYYMPRDGEDVNTSRFIAPALERVVEIRDLEDVTFQGIYFEHSNWTDVDDEGFVGIQASSYRLPDTGAQIPGGVYVTESRDLLFYRNVFRNLGGVGVELRRGTKGNEFIGNVFTDISSTGINVYTDLSVRNPPPHLESTGDVIRNNYVHGVARDYTGGVGIMGSYTAALIIEHNEVTHLPYTGINVGWGWLDWETALRDNEVRYNEIHDVMRLHDDGAGIYTLSLQPGTIIERNYVHDITRSQWADPFEIAALYLDEQTDQLTLRENVVHDLNGANMLEVKLHQAGDDNVIYDNGTGIDDEADIVDDAGLQPEYQDIRAIVED